MTNKQARNAALERCKRAIIAELGEEASFMLVIAGDAQGLGAQCVGTGRAAPMLAALEFTYRKVSQSRALEPSLRGLPKGRPN